MRTAKVRRRVSVDESALDAWLAYVEETARADALEKELALLRGSRSWKITAPLRAANRLADRLQPAWSQPSRPELRPPVSGGVGTIVPGELHAPLDRILSRIMTGNGPRLYVDVTALDLEDLGAGIQRVTRRVLGAMYADMEMPFVPVPVCLRNDGQYYPAHRFLERFLGLPPESLGGEDVLSPRHGDAFLGLDLCREFAAVLGSAWAALRQAGVRILPVVYDVLPVERPDWFPEPVSSDLRRWLEVIAEFADLAVCISEATREAFVRALSSDARRVPQTIVVPMGCDGLRMAIPDQVASRRCPRQVLMVGTIEPRKGHADVLEAFDRLWADGRDLRLVIVGHPGWKVDGLLSRIRKISSGCDRLEWLEQADDRTLQGLYRSSSLLVAASEGEGFGLPVIEAAAAGCRLLLRDLPVFREVAGADARYFASSGDLEAALREFSVDASSWPSPPSAGDLSSWGDTVEAIWSHAARMSGRPIES